MKTHFFMHMLDWSNKRLKQLPERDRFYSVFFILAFLIATAVVSVLVAIGNPFRPSLFSHLMLVVLALAGNGLLFVLATLIFAACLSFLSIPVPRLLFGSFLYTAAVSVTILLIDESGTLFSLIVGIGYTLAAVGLGLFLIVFYRIYQSVGYKVTIVVLSLLLVLASLHLYVKNKHEFASHSVQALEISDENPAKNGQYEYRFLTYGSGEDPHRPEYGKDVDILTPPVDASNIVTKWDKKREWFWNFDPSTFPVNGRMWIPKGNGPFPVILMVHGNHIMEDFSTNGYDYFGKLLASRGFIAVSVDEDFINYSSYSRVPNQNYELRAWMLLQHLLELKKINSSSQSDLYQKMDFEQVALIGHSRGGQAVAMAANYPKFFADDNLIDQLDSIKIKGVIAIAPTDYSVDGKSPTLQNISYLLIQGARDADVIDFPGEEQFQRTYFNKSSSAFKAALYIEGANHSQFNETWGSMDASLPTGLLLNREQIMDPKEQRQIAKVYISAFLEDVFHENSQYEQLFRNAHYGEKWLPETRIISQYQNATYTPFIQYTDSKDDFTNEIATDATGFEEANITTPKDRRGNERTFDALHLKWDKPADYTIHFPKQFLKKQVKLGSKKMVLTIANMKLADEQDEQPKIEISLETNDGTTVQLPLNDFMPIAPVISTHFTHFGWLDAFFDDGKYKNSWEPIFQTIEFPIEAFSDENPELNIEDAKTITIHFSSQSGEVLLKEVALED